jgi:3',5'-cyclic AMP phosphodiesterase CpdA
MLRLVLVSDLHLGAGQQHHHDNWLKVAAWIAREKPDVVVANGDLIMGNPDDETDYAFTRDELAKLHVPCRFLPGNHDVGDNVVFGDQAERVNDERRARFARYFGEERWSFDAAGWGFVGIDALLFASGGQPAEAAQWQWLESSLNSHAGKPIALFTHKPLFMDFPGEPNPGSLELASASFDSDSRSRLLALMKRHHVRLVVSGHMHQTRSFSVDGTYYLWAPSTACVIGTPDSKHWGVREVGFIDFRFSNGNFEHCIVGQDFLFRHESYVRKLALVS